MMPRTAGILGMLGAAALVVLFAFLIADPPFSILGALGLVASAIFFAIAASWTTRKSWSPSSQPEVKVRAVTNKPPGHEILVAGFSGAATMLIVNTWRIAIGNESGWAGVHVGALYATVMVVALLVARKRRRPK